MSESEVHDATLLDRAREFIEFSGQPPTRALVEELVEEIKRLRGASSASPWREIRCAEVEWHAIPGASKRVGWLLLRQCSPPTEYDDKNVERWHELTLGRLADLGERWWRHSAGMGFGTEASKAVKLAIDHAAAGFDVTRKADAYTPRPIQHEKE